MSLMLVNSFLISLFIGLAGHGDFLHPASISFAPAKARPVVALQVAQPSAPIVAQPPRKKDADSLGVKLTAKSAALVDTKTGTLLFSYGQDQILPIASITKLMTALVLLDGPIDWNAKVTIQPSDFDYTGLLSIKAGDTMTTQDAWNTMLSGSVNAAAVALARSTGLSREQFVAKMNAKAQELGLAHTTFTDPTGYGASNVSTTLDLARLAWNALSNDQIRQAVTLKGVDYQTEAGDARHITATNELLDSYLNTGDYGVVGGKTGFTDEAGYTMVLRATQGPGDIIAVVLGSPTSDDRFQDAKSLLAWGFRTFEWTK
jgi:D-alanyl-D-alanine carboxypeptidase